MKMTIQPVSALRDYNKLLHQVDDNNPVFLTKNGYGKYAIINIKDYDRYVNGMKLLKELDAAANEKGFRDATDVFKEINK